MFVNCLINTYNIIVYTVHIIIIYIIIIIITISFQCVPHP